MKRTRTEVNKADFPALFHPLLDCDVYDSSCSRAAKVWFLDAEGGSYLKRMGKGQLEKEAIMTRYFHENGLAAEVLAYESSEYDWLLTRQKILCGFCSNRINREFKNYKSIYTKGVGYDV